MAIQYKFFMISMKNTSEAEEVFNRFLRGGNIINITKEFVGQGENSFWSIAVEYHTGTGASASDKRGRVDYREVLSPEDFAIYAKLREWRRTIAEKESTQLFNVFTNDQMAPPFFPAAQRAWSDDGPLTRTESRPRNFPGRRGNAAPGLVVGMEVPANVPVRRFPPEV